MLSLQNASKPNFLNHHLNYIVMLILMVWLGFITLVHAADKEPIGWLEEISINNHELQLKAKIDTGATTSSLHAKVIKKFTRDKQRWVQFRVENKEGEDIFLERKILRTVKIKRKLALPIQRYVISLGICLGNSYREMEVNLANRENFVYRVLIGRNYLKDHFLVDSSRTFTTSPNCH